MSPAVQVKHDKFNPDGDSVQLDIDDAVSVNQSAADILFSPETPRFGIWMISAAPRAGRVDETVTMQFNSSSRRGWQYLKCHTVSLLIDGQAYPIADEKHDGNVGTASVSEYISFKVPLSLVEQMGAAKAVLGKICNTEFTVTPNSLSEMRNFVTAVRTGVVPLSGGAAPSAFGGANP
jgi:hypothetical protein